jgi:hypothetical protein
MPSIDEMNHAALDRLEREHEPGAYKDHDGVWRVRGQHGTLGAETSPFRSNHGLKQAQELAAKQLGYDPSTATFDRGGAQRMSADSWAKLKAGLIAAGVDPERIPKDDDMVRREWNPLAKPEPTE